MVDVPHIQIEEAIRQFVIGATGLAEEQVIYANQSSPSPNGEYATVLTIAIDQDGVDWSTYSGAQEIVEQLDAVTTGNREISFSVQFYRQNTMENARKTLQYAKTPNGKFLLQQNNLSWRRESEITQIDSVDQGNKWEKRSAITLNFGYIETTTQIINSLDSSEITVDYSGETDIREVLDVTSS